MKSFESLPAGYSQIMEVNLQKNKKVAFMVNGAAVLVMVVMFVVANFFVPVSIVFDMVQNGEFLYVLLMLLVMLASSLAYMVLHELAHAVAMKAFGTKKVKFGYTGVYAFAGSNDYYTKGAYLIIALAPVVVWGVILAVLNAFVPLEWFWVVYFVQMSNISGAAGDFYVTLKFMKLPKDILVHDSGVDMKVYSAEIK